MKTAVGIDIGTTTLSFSVYDIDTEETVKSFSVDNALSLPPDVQDGDLQKCENMILAVRSMLEAICAGYDVVSVGVTGQMHGILYLNSEGEAVSPLFTWRDGRGNLLCGIDPDKRSWAEYLSALTGCRCASGYGLVTHFYNLHNGLVPDGAVKLCTVADYAVMKLTERKVPLMHVTNAAGLGAFSLEKGRFELEALAEAGITADFLPDVTSRTAVAGYFYDRSGRSVPVAVAIGDNQASFLGSVPDSDNSVLINAGTGGQVSFIGEGEINVPGLEKRPYFDGRSLYVASSLCCGRALGILEQFLRDTVKFVTGQEIVSAYGAIDEFLMSISEEDGGVFPDDSLKVSTVFDGTRDDPGLRGSIDNISPHNFTPEELVLGFLRGMAEELWQYYRDAGADKKLLVGSGGAIRRNPAFVRYIEKLFGRELWISDYTEEAAHGAAVFGQTAKERMF